MPLTGLVFTDTSLNNLSYIPHKTRVRVIKKTKALINNARPPGSVKLKGVTNNGESVYRIRCGDYRVLYVIRSNPAEVVVLDIDHRKDVYQ